MERLKWIDKVKGISIILIVLGHTFASFIRENNNFVTILKEIVYSFHVIPFFIVSGYLYYSSMNNKRKIEDKKYIFYKLKKCILPFVSFTVIYYLLIEILNIILNKESVLTINQFINNILFYKNHPDKHLWFIYTLLFMYLINYFSMKYINNNYKVILIITCISAFIGGMGYIPYIEVLNIILYYNIFFFFGILINKLELVINLENKRNKILLFIIFFIGEIGYLISLLYGIQILRILFRIVVGISFYFILIYLIETKKYLGYYNILEEIGKNSLEIYLLHQPFLTVGMMFIFYKLNISIIISSIVTTILSISICYIISKKIINKSKLLNLLLFAR